MLMGWYHINCICMDTYTLRDNETWANLSWAGNVQQIYDAGFDGVKIDNCGDDLGSGYGIITEAEPGYRTASPSSQRCAHLPFSDDE